jgi:hypothetical protein
MSSDLTYISIANIYIQLIAKTATQPRSVCDLIVWIQDVPGFDKYLPSGAETNLSTLEDISSETPRISP